MTIVWLIVAAIPISLTVWALLDAARRPAWAWSLANRSQLIWLTAIGFGLFLSFVGMAISLYYLWRVRPTIAAVEDGDFRRLE